MPLNGNGMPPNGNEKPEEVEEESDFFGNLFNTSKGKVAEGVNKIETGIGSAKDTIEAKTAATSKGLMDSFTGFFKSDANPNPNPNLNLNPTAAAPAAGGRRRSRSKSMKMRGGLNPAFGYNAAPVINSDTAEPTYMMEYTGGKRRRRTCKKKRKCCKKSCRKRHRHIHRR